MNFESVCSIISEVFDQIETSSKRDLAIAICKKGQSGKSFTLKAVAKTNHPPMASMLASNAIAILMSSLTQFNETEILNGEMKSEGGVTAVSTEDGLVVFLVYVYTNLEESESAKISMRIKQQISESFKGRRVYGKKVHD